MVCYEYIVSRDTFDKKSLQAKQKSLNELNNEAISDKDYRYAQKVWNRFNIGLRRVLRSV